MITPTAAESVAAALVAARRNGNSLSGFPGDAPASMSEAYRIQDAAMAQWPDTLVGWKIGYIPADRRRAGEADRLVGPIWQQSFHHGGTGREIEVGIFATGFAAVEAELVVRLLQDVPVRDSAPWTAAEAAALEQELWFGIEVASSPIPDINSLGPTVIVSDFGNNFGLVLGTRLTDPGETGPVRLACFIDGQLIAEGSADNLPGGMHHGLATALNLLAGRGHRVGAGTLFATGAITGIHPIGPGQRCRVEVTGGPPGAGEQAVELRTAAARPQV